MRVALAWWIGLVALGLAAQAVPLCSFQSPVTDLSDLLMSFSYQYTNDPYGSDERDTNEGSFIVDYTRLYDSPEYGFDVYLANRLDISVLHESSYRTNAQGNYKRYLTSEGDAFAFAGGTAKSSSSFSSLGMSVTLGLGLGRFSDVTPLAVATRVDDYLVSRGTLREHLRDADLRILAWEIAAREKYASFEDFLDVVREIVESSGFARVGGLDALDLSKVGDLLKDEGFTRYCGWDGKLGVGYEVLDPSGGERDLLVIGSFNVAFTTTPNAQLLVGGGISGPPDLFTTNRVDLSAQYDYLISEFLNLRAAYSFSRETWAGTPTDVHRIGLDVTMTPLTTADVTLALVMEHRPYYLEWSVDVKLGISIQLL